MILRGHIKNGVVVPDTPVALPDGTVVRIEVEAADSDFWRGRTIEALASEQRVKQTPSAEDLVIDWPEGDSVDEFLAVVREVRR